MTNNELELMHWSVEDLIAVTDEDLERLHVSEEDWARCRIDESDLVVTPFPQTQPLSGIIHGHARQKT